MIQHKNFYPRSPCGERPPSIFRHCTTYLFLSTLSLRRATWDVIALMTDAQSISIHALLAESDQTANGLADTPPHISIHALLAESDLINARYTNRHVAFLSTLSLRRATVGASQGADSEHISIHALLAESDSLSRRIIPNQHISIHALLAESDGSAISTDAIIMIFLSTLSLRRATGI